MFQSIIQAYRRWKYTHTFTCYLRNAQTGAKSESFVRAVPQLENDLRFTHYMVHSKQVSLHTGAVMLELENIMSVQDYHNFAAKFAN